VRNIYDAGDDKAILFVNDHLRAENAGDGYAFGAGTNCNLKTMKGVAIGRDITQNIEQTSYTSSGFDYDGTVVYDAYPEVGKNTMFDRGEGLAKYSFMYDKTDPDIADADEVGAGIATTTLQKNMVYIPVDWRHMADAEAVLRSIMDYYEKNGGTEIPIELANFNAKAVANRVEVSWTTASELNSDRFEVEKAEINGAVKGSFSKIAEKAGAGKSSVDREYGPVIDRNVDFGKTYIYRLKMVDLDGQYAYSDERMVEIGGEGLWLSEAVPNPVKDMARFDISTDGREVELSLYDNNGRKLTSKYEINNGVLSLDMSGVQSGAYTLVVHAGEITMNRQISVTK
jgi:hypothetical protein